MAPKTPKMRQCLDEYSHLPCFCMQCKNLTMTFELGRMRTWRFPAFSALLMALSASLRTLVLTMIEIMRFSTRVFEVRYLQKKEIQVSDKEVGS